MNKKILLMSLACSFLLGATAQKKSKPVNAFAITSVEKGNGRWTEVREVNLQTGEELKSIYRSAEEVPVFNARTGKAIVKKENEVAKTARTMAARRGPKRLLVTVGDSEAERKLINSGISTDASVKSRTNVNPRTKVVMVRSNVRLNSMAPFATQSAACAYDKKHNRLYYTPMGINQLRYIDLRSKNSQVYFFEDEPFGALSGPGDVQNQVTRMVIAGDGNGYALTNNANHLIRFTTNKKAEVTDLGALSDDASSGKHSVHGNKTHGGDMVADKSGNLYLITAQRAVYKINISSMVAQYKGSIKGLPAGFTTNGAVVEKGTSVIVSSATATSGYYRFDLNTLVAEKVSESEKVYNASDLANANLVTYAKKDKEKPAEIVVAEQVDTESPAKELRPNDIEVASITVFPNPVTSGSAKIVFNGYKNGRYEIQLLSMNGKLIQKKVVFINYKSQQMQINNLKRLAKGNYFVNVTNDQGGLVNTEKIIVQ